MASASTPLDPQEAVALVSSYLAHLVETGDYAESTAIKACALMTKFARYAARRFGTTDVRDLGSSEIHGFINAPILKDEERREVTERTKENRYWAVDLLFRTLRGLNLYDGDPLLDAPRYPRIMGDCRPLLDAEVERCRKFASRRLDDTLGPARLALAEAMATAGEIHQVTVGDYDSANNQVWLRGTDGRIHERWSTLLPWGVDVIEQRIAELGPSADLSTPIAYHGGGGAGGPSVATITLRAILDRAGLSKIADPTVKPKSFRAWGARRLYDETRDIQEVAHRLGVSTFEAARRIIQLPEFPRDEPPPHRRGT